MGGGGKGSESEGTSGNEGKIAYRCKYCKKEFYHKKNFANHKRQFHAAEMKGLSSASSGLSAVKTGSLTPVPSPTPPPVSPLTEAESSSQVKSSSSDYVTPEKSTSREYVTPEKSLSGEIVTPAKSSSGEPQTPAKSSSGGYPATPAESFGTKHSSTEKSDTEGERSSVERSRARQDSPVRQTEQQEGTETGRIGITRNSRGRKDSDENSDATIEISQTPRSDKGQRRAQTTKRTHERPEGRPGLRPRRTEQQRASSPPPLPVATKNMPLPIGKKIKVAGADGEEREEWFRNPKFRGA